jgi:AcrR family transcriptional regulator
VAGLSLRSIARRAGVSATAPYHHFAGKKGHLLAAVAAQGFRKLATALRRAPLRDMPPDERLPAMCRGYVRFARTHPKLFRLMFGSELAEKETYAELTDAAAAGYAALVGRVEEVLGDAGTLPAVDANDVAVAVWALGHGIASLMVEGQISPTVKRVIDNERAQRVTAACLGHLPRQAGAQRAVICTPAPTIR